MVTGKIAGVNKVRKRLADGTIKIFYYHRATGTRINAEPHTKEFTLEWAVAEKSMQDRLAGTFSGLMRDYFLSPQHAKKAKSTDVEYRRIGTKAEAKFGNLPLAALEDPRVRKDFMDYHAEVARSSGQREADNRLSVISAILSWGKENGHIFSNHVVGFRRLYHSDRSELIWLPEHIQAIMAVADVGLQRALILALHTGQRQGDLLRLTWGNYDGKLISFRQGKTGRRVDIPCTKALRKMLDGVKRDAAVVLTTKTGKPWKARYFKAQWEAASKKAGITDLHFHDLRGTAITMLAEAGCTTPQIAAITGHSMKTVTTILDKYLARTRALAGEAVTLFENAKSTKFANRLQTRTPKAVKGVAK